MQQSEMPWRESAEEATAAAIHKSGRAFKEVAHALWPSMKMDSAYARLKACLADDKREKLTADEHLFIAGFVEQFDFLAYCCQTLHHRMPEQIHPDDERAALAQAFVRSVRDLRAIEKRITALGRVA